MVQKKRFIILCTIDGRSFILIYSILSLITPVKILGSPPPPPDREKGGGGVVRLCGGREGGRRGLQLSLALRPASSSVILCVCELHNVICKQTSPAVRYVISEDVRTPYYIGKFGYLIKKKINFHFLQGRPLSVKV